jgi:hypothetical protein
VGIKSSPHTSLDMKSRQVQNVQDLLNECIKEGEVPYLPLTSLSKMLL